LDFDRGYLKLIIAQLSLAGHALVGRVFLKIEAGFKAGNGENDANPGAQWVLWVEGLWDGLHSLLTY